MQCQVVSILANYNARLYAELLTWGMFFLVWEICIHCSRKLCITLSVLRHPPVGQLLKTPSLLRVLTGMYLHTPYVFPFKAWLDRQVQVSWKWPVDYKLLFQHDDRQLGL